MLAALEKDCKKPLHNIQVIGLEEYGLLPSMCKRLVEKHGKVIVAVSLMTKHFIKYRELLESTNKVIKKILGEHALLVAGGPHPTGDPVGTLKLGFDLVVVGEGEETLHKLVTMYEEGGDVYNVGGIFYRFEERYYFTGRRRPLNLDDYPAFPWWRRRFSPIEITRGCHWGCRYCETWFIHGGGPRHRSIDSILEHAKIMLEHGLKDLRFIAPNALGYGESCRRCRRIDLLQELLEKLRSLTSVYGGRIFLGSFPSEVRPDYVDEEAARLLKHYVFNKRVIIGAQSGSERILHVINRGHTVDDVLNAVEVLARHGFKPEVDFIFGLPEESEEDIDETIKVMRRLVALGARIHAHSFMPLPGTPFENAEPGKVPMRLRKEIYRLIGYHALYGQWEAQERLALQIHRLYKEGVILGLRGWRLARYKPGRY